MPRMGSKGVQRSPRTGMNKRELTQRIQLHMGVGCTRQSAEAALHAVLSSIVHLSQEGSVPLAGFGRFAQRVRPTRMGHHPLSGEPLTIPARRQLHFAPSPKLLDQGIYYSGSH